MAPPERKTANVQEILKNPVQSNQKPLFKQKEGIWGWLSYIGWALTIVFPLIVFLCNLFYFSSSLNLAFPLLDSGIINLIIIFVGVIITAVNIWKSKYPLSNKCRKIILSMFFIFTFLLELIASGNLLELNIICFTAWLWSFLFFWYLHYFYRKSKDGYRKVWVKVILFTVIPILPLSYFVEDYYEPLTMGDYLTVDPNDPFYQQ
ncbi:MAG: hypothetical protein E7021_01930 [Alphaproteobacteria bacterium]|nr:hypothetical protein [Alphaproteobacteria bacterium]